MNRITRTIAIIALCTCFFCIKVHCQENRGSTSLELGLASNSDNQLGFNVGLSHFAKTSIFIDYVGITNKDGFYYHEISPKLGKYLHFDLIDFSIATGFDVAMYPGHGTGPSIFNNDKSSSLFFGIPIQARIDVCIIHPVYFGAKLAYVISTMDKFDSRASFIAYLAVRFGKR